jgi:hypothetical protein
MTTSAPSPTARRAPPRTTGSTIGWIGQGLLLLAGVVLVVLATRRIRVRAVRVAAVLLGPLGVALFVVTTALAVSSF